MMRSSAYNRFGVLMGASWPTSCPRWYGLREDSLPMITLFPSQGDFCATAPGVIGILAGQTQVTRHVDAPFVSHILWSIIDDSGFVVSPVMSSASASFSFQVLTGKMGTCPSPHCSAP